MKIEDIEEQIAALDLPRKQKKAILSLIDLKADNEMEKSFTRFESLINALRADMDSKFSAIDDKFAAIDDKFAAIDGKFAAIDSKFTTQFNLLKWIIGGIGGVIICLSILITILKFIG